MGPMQEHRHGGRSSPVRHEATRRARPGLESSQTLPSALSLNCGGGRLVQTGRLRPSDISAVSEANRRDSFGQLGPQSSLSIQPFEGSRFVRGGRYGISIDFGLAVVEKQSVCGTIFESEFIELTKKRKLTITSS